MNSVEELLLELGALGIRLTIEGERLRVSAPKGTLTPDLQAELVQHKAAIVAFLHSVDFLPDSGSPAIRPVVRDGTLPLSFAQQRLWFLDQLEPGSSTYNISTVCRFVGRLDLTALERSINEIIRRHEALRTTFCVSDGQPWQMIAPSLVLSLSVVDLQACPEREREAEALRLASEQAQLPFDLAKGPLLRAALFRLSEREHIFCLVIHHIVSDAWSETVLFRELGTLYAAFSCGKSSPLTELSIQYADYALWQRERLQGEVLARQTAYWRRQLDGAPVLELPTDYPRPARQSHRGAMEAMRLSRSSTRALKVVSQQQGATLFMTLLAAFEVLLYRYTGQHDIVVGAPTAGRLSAEVEGLIGFFLNSLALRNDLSGDPTFLELLERVRSVSLDALAHQELSFEKLLEELRVERDLSRTPLFQLFFNMLSMENLAIALPGIEVEVLSLPEVESKFDLTVYCRESSGEIRFRFAYSTDLFTAARIREMMAQYEGLLTQIVGNPAQRISQLTLVTPVAAKVLPDPTQSLSGEWRGAIHARVAQHARETPGRVALVDSQASWTYQELDQRSNQLANHLIANGIRAHDVVAIYGHRNAALVWAILGIQKAGAVFLILDPAFPPARLIRCLRTAAPRGWIHLEAAGALPRALEEYLTTSSCCCRLVLPGRSAAAERGLLAGYSEQEPQFPTSPDDPACIVFTSGSTGEPKGILGRHGSLTHFEPWRQELCGLTQHDRFAMLSGLAYSPLQRDIFTPLWLGATLFVPDDETIGALGRLATWMAEQRITFAGLTPAMGQILAETAARGSRLPALRNVFFVGDRLSRRDVFHLRYLAPNVTSINTYGATETQRADAYFVIPEEPEVAHVKALYPLGRGMPDVQLLVLNGAGQLAGVGELGEIYVRSPHLALGYLGDEALTRARFITNPFTGRNGDRLYRTGDLGRYLPDGNVEFSGRADRQVKIRGFRIELAEIETVLEQHPGLRQSVVSYRDDTSGDPSATPGTGGRLVAYLVPKEMPGPTVSELRSFLIERLPEYMVPTAFVLLDALPLTPNGKIDHRALPEPDQTRPELDKAFVAPRDPVECQLVRIWEEVLGIHPVGIGDDFFALGGHSLLGIRLLARIEKDLGEKLPVALLFQSPTVERLAQAIRNGAAELECAPLVPIRTEGSRPPLFCVPPMGHGSVLAYRKLAEYLGPDQPVYGLQPRGSDGSEMPLYRIEDIAAYHVQQIRRKFLHGPYLIAGYSFGGLIAYETARALHNLHQEVGLVALLDTSAYLAPRNSRALPWSLAIRRFVAHVTLRLGKHVDNLAALSWTSRAAYVVERFRRMVRQIRHEPVLHMPPDLQEALWSALNRYVPKPYPGRVTLLRTSTHAARYYDEESLGWAALATGGVEIRDVPGDHWSMIVEPHVQVLARQLRACIDMALSRRQGEYPPDDGPTEPTAVPSGAPCRGPSSKEGDDAQ